MDVLWAMLDGRKANGLDNEKVRNIAMHRHCDLAKRMRNPRMHNSALKQLRWLITVLPEKGKNRAVRAAMQELLAGIEGTHQ